MKLADLAKEFPRETVHWRAQTLTRDGDKALALAYLDARDVMDRLDEVCGPDKWQSEVTETARGRVICRLGIICGDTWVWKSDGAGDTAVEGEKGGISDSLKRAAVQWGIGRYLYRMPNVWVPCEVNNQGKWKSWKVDPWSCVRNAPQPKQPDKTPAEKRDWVKTVILSKEDAQALDGFWKRKDIVDLVSTLPEPMQGELQKAYTDQMARVYQAPEAAE